MVHQEHREKPKDLDTEVVRRALDNYASGRPWINPDNGPQCITRDFMA
jgi:hypothetical protein